ncbi:hypothetical protein MK292_06645 [Myxococcota bacterium]|nr:hypothetical protein [Myxococcota bacterium]
MLLWCVSTAALISWPGHKASGESALRLSLPEKYETINANTYDEEGNAVGDARLVIATDKDGNTVLEGEAGITHSASTTYSIVLEPTKHSKLKPLLQKSHSIDVEGNSLGMLTINHVKGFASCSSSESDPKKKIRTLKLPSNDLVSNIPLSLLFRPLVEGKEKEISFQIFLCRPKPRLIHANAKVVRSKKNAEGIVEVQYTISLGNLLNRVASPFLPKLSVWFDPKIPNMWIGHRVPLYTQGPTVTILRLGNHLKEIGVKQKLERDRKF